jgi:hypothetical protein
MAKQVQSPESILPMRMRLKLPEETGIRFSVLYFPFGKAMNRFISSFRSIHERQSKEAFHNYPPDRLLNDGFMALSPSLIQAFEGKRWDWEDKRMVTFTHYDEHGEAIEFPSLRRIKSFILHWLKAWGKEIDVENTLRGEVKQAWDELLAAVRGQPDCDWEHGINPSELAKNLKDKEGLAYIALPALFPALLHGKTISCGKETITWRKAHSGGSNGLYLVSQPIRYKEDYFAYSLEFSLQTQTRANSQAETWVFANLGIQRYIQQKFRKDKVDTRAFSVLVAFNQEGFRDERWDIDKTLIQLRLKKTYRGYVWKDDLGDLLKSFQIHDLQEPPKLLETPQNYGNYTLQPDFQRDEYYLVYAEGRKFGDESTRSHQVKTGTSLRERNQIMREVMAPLDDFLELSPVLQKDIQADPSKSFAMRDIAYMLKERNGKDGNKKQMDAWSKALKNSLESTGHSHLHLIVLYRHEAFLNGVKPEIDGMIGGQPLIKVDYIKLPLSYYAPLDEGELEAEDYWKEKKDKPEGFMDKWNAQMKKSYGEKREAWQKFLKTLAWDTSARCLVLIDSTGETKLPDSKKDIPPNQKIKGAVRDACHREGILSQFIVSDGLKLEGDITKPRYGKLDNASRAKLRNALFDLLLRQQGLLFAPPAEIYEKLALLPKEYADSLDIIAFCRLQKANPKFHYALAVRLRADGQVHVAFPSDSKKWIPYTEAAAKLGICFSDERANLRNNKADSPLRLKADDLVNFVYGVLRQDFERPTIAVIEAEVWRNGKSDDEDKHCWTQLRNADMGKKLDRLDFGLKREYSREGLQCLLGVVRLRMNDETPHYISADSWSSEEAMRDIPQLTGYLDTVVTNPMHYFSLGRLPETQKDQTNPRIVEALKAEAKRDKYDEIAYKHAQLVEMLPFFVHPDFQTHEGQKQLLRAIHFLRISPAFTSGNILQPYPMHLGEKLIDDQLTIINADD